MKKAKYVGTGTFRYGDTPIKPGDTIDGPPALVDALLERADFEAEGSAAAEIGKLKPKKKKSKAKKEDDPTLEVEIGEED